MYDFVFMYIRNVVLYTQILTGLEYKSKRI